MRLLENIQVYDHLTFTWCLKRKRRDMLVKVSRAVSKTADGPLYLAVCVALYFAGYTETLPLFAFAFALERSIYFVAKKSFKRNRPPDAIPGYRSVIQPSDKFSFPSGHTSAAFLMLTLLASLFPFIFWIMLPWAVCVGISRVMLGVHFPTDILAGATLGSSVSWIALHVIAL